MDARETIARARLTRDLFNADWDDQHEGHRQQLLADAEADLAALRAAGFDVVPRQGIAISGTMQNVYMVGIKITASGAYSGNTMTIGPPAASRAGEQEAQG